MVVGKSTTSTCAGVYGGTTGGSGIPSGRVCPCGSNIASHSLTATATSSATATASSTATATTPPIVDVWVTGSVTDSNSSLPLAGVNVTGSRGAVFSDVNGTFALFAPIVGDRVVVRAGGLRGYSSTTGSAKYIAGVLAYTVPLHLTPFSVQSTFNPAMGLPPVDLPLASAFSGSASAFSGGLSVTVSVPATSAPGLPTSATIRVSVVPPSAGPGLLEVDPAYASNRVTRLEVRECVRNDALCPFTTLLALVGGSPAECSGSASLTEMATPWSTLPASGLCLRRRM